MFPKLIHVVTIFCSVLLLHVRSWKMVGVDDYIRECDVRQNELVLVLRKQLFLFDIEVLEGGCTVQCVYLIQSKSRFLEKTLPRRFTFGKDDGSIRCLDGEHVCHYGACRRPSNNSFPQVTSPPPSPLGDVDLFIKDARLERLGIRKAPSPFLEIAWGSVGRKFRSQTIRNTYRPIWNEEFSMSHFGLDGNLQIIIKDGSSFSHKKIAQVNLTPRHILADGNNGHFVFHSLLNTTDNSFPYLQFRFSWRNV